MGMSEGLVVGTTQPLLAAEERKVLPAVLRVSAIMTNQRQLRGQSRKDIPLTCLVWRGSAMYVAPPSTGPQRTNHPIPPLAQEDAFRCCSYPDEAVIVDLALAVPNAECVFWCAGRILRRARI